MERRRGRKTGGQKRTPRAPADDVQREVERGQRTRPWQCYLEAELGLRNYWYPVLFSHELPEGEVRAATILGERLFFKRINGQVYGVEDRCLHRGVPFSVRPRVLHRAHLHLLVPRFYHMIGVTVAWWKFSPRPTVPCVARCVSSRILPVKGIRSSSYGLVTVPR